MLAIPNETKLAAIHPEVLAQVIGVSGSSELEVQISRGTTTLADDLDDAWFQFDDTVAVDDGLYYVTPLYKRARVKVVFAVSVVAAAACLGITAM